MAPLATAFVLVLPNMAAFPGAAAAGIRGANLAGAGAAQGAAFGAGFAKSAGKLMAAGVVIGLGVLLKDSVKAAGDFEAQMVRLVTSAGETGTLVSGNLKIVAEGIKAMAGPVGTTVEALGKAMYTVESGSFHGADALKVLRAAAEGAKAENADLTKVTNATTTALVDYHLSADHSAEVVTKLVAATAAGKTTFEQLTGALHSVLPVASAAGISLDDILGSLASMTLHGISAEQATQNLADAIRHMQNPTAQQAKELALLGLTTNQLAEDLKTKGLSGTLGEISDRIRKLMPPGSDKVILDLKTALGSLSPEVRTLGMDLINGRISYIEYRKAARDLTPIQASQAMSFAALAGATHRIGDEQLSGTQTMQSYAGALARATGDATGMNVALMLTGENAATTATAIGMVAGATVEAGNHVKGWGEIQETFNFKMSALKASVGVAAVAIGESLLPAIGEIVSGIQAVLGPMAEWMTKHQMLTGIIAGSLTAFLAIGTSIVIFTKLIAVFKLLAAAMRLAAIAQFLFLSPWGLIILAIAAVAAGLVYAFFHFKTFHDWIMKAWGWLKTAGIATWDALVVAFHAVADASIWLWQHALKPAFDGIVVAVGYWWAYAKLAFAFWKGAVETVASVAMWLWQHALGPAFAGITVVVKLWWQYAEFVFGLVKWTILNVVVPVVLFLWHNVYEPAFHALTGILKAWWEYAKTAFAFWKGAAEVVAAVVMWLWHNVFEPAFNAMGVLIHAWWVIAQVVFAAAKIAVDVLLIQPAERLWHLMEFVWPYVSSLLQVWWSAAKIVFNAWKTAFDILLIEPVRRFISITEPIWRRLGDLIKFTWDNGIKPTLQNMANFVLHTIPDAFSAGAGFVGSAWDKVKGFVASPVNAVIRFVLNDGIIKGWNTIAGWVGVKDRIPNLPTINLADGGSVGAAALKAYADGGRIHGFGGPRQDNIPIMASAGEYIIPAHVVSDMGVGWFDGLIGRKKPAHPGDGSGGISIGRYADGGIVGFLTNPSGWVGDRVNGLFDKVPGGGIVRDISVAAAHRLVEGLIAWAKSKVTSIFSGGGSAAALAGNPGGILGWLQAQNGKPYVWASAGPGGYDCCLPARTLVYGPNGPKRIDELAAGDAVWSRTDAGELVEQKIVAAWRSKDQQVFRLKLRGRNVDASANHPFLRVKVSHAKTTGGPCRTGGCTRPARGRGLCGTCYSYHLYHGTLPADFDPVVSTETEWVRLDQLRRGDLVVVLDEAEHDGDDSPWLPDGTEVTDDFAWLLGAIVGDGTVTEDSVRCAAFGAFRDEFQRRALSTWNVAGTQHDSAGVIISRTALARRLLALGLHWRGEDKRVPAAVWGWSLRLKLAFCAGYAAADGSVSTRAKRGGGLSYSGCSRRLIDEVRSVHLEAGHRVTNVTTNYRTRPIVIKGKPVLNAKPLHTFTVSSTNGEAYAKLRQLQNHIAVKYLGGNFGLRLVQGVETLGVEPTYDLNVTENHNFVADGVVVHNSGIVSAVWNLMHGANPYRHTFSTSGEGLFFNKRNQYGMLTAGWANPGERGGGSVGHTAGMFAGVGFESTGSRGVRVGAGTTPVTSFAHWGTFDRGGRWPNNTIGVNTSGRTEYVSSADAMETNNALLREQNALLREQIDAIRGVGPAVGREINGGVSTLRQMARTR